MTTASDDRLELLLSEIGPRLDTGVDTLDLPALLEDSPFVNERSGRDRPLWLVAAAAVLLLAAGTVLVVAPAREAVADWLRIGRTRIEAPAPDATGRPVATDAPPAAPAPGEAISPPATDAARLETEARGIEAGEAARVLGRPLPYIEGLRAREILSPAEGGVLIAYDDGVTLWVQNEQPTGIPLLKSASGSITWLDDLGDGGAIISGAHTLTTPGRVLRSDTVVLWTADGLELRLEGDRSDQAMLATARLVSLD